MRFTGSRHLRRLPLLSPLQWKRRLVLWCGGVLVALVAIGFAHAADAAQALFAVVTAWNPWIVFGLAPGGLALSLWLTRRVFPGAQGSGIPQAIAALHMTDPKAVDAVLSLRVALGKVVLTVLGLGVGASIGREGPTVQVGAAIMNAVGRITPMPRLEMQRALVLAGGAAGVAAAFNTPLAGIVFAIEELSHSFEQRTSGVVLTAVILAGITTVALSGNYTYFGHSAVVLDVGRDWLAVLPCAVVGGLAGGLFSQVLISASRGLPGRIGRWVARHPLLVAVLCGVVLAGLGVLSGGATYGTGYAQARGLVEGHADLPAGFAVMKLLATVVSYLSGIPGGIFAPSLAVGAGLGSWLHAVLPGFPPGALVLLGMVAYFSGVVQAPITATVIVMEMTDNQQMTIPLLATAMLAFGVSRLVCRRSFYSALARRFLDAVERPRPAD
ncbi:Chloride channel protein [Rhodovastum atsumiense]|uniref:Chloride channel protein n=1 Tax=Rhodovastum atsumiense TaxID=504468 RepID=A0A5M6IYK8_9PROT|nr:chloride channel protein [Rhodovastum atsumiense]KAA5613029.1 chloride channel protein [Rhodovastum atsumiense]CAH2600116.1 Chloride channel protein [Rhodovastum atsumiense]